MKKTFLLTVVILPLLLNKVSAQFSPGQSFIAGSFYNAFDNTKNEGLKPTNYYNHSLYLSFGKFVKENKAVGWSITQDLITQQYNNLDVEPRRLKKLGFGVERFWEYYKPLTEKLSVYVRPQINVSYSQQNDFQAGNNQLLLQSKMNNISLAAGVGAGLAFKLTGKWAIYGGFAFSNPINVTYGFGHVETYPNSDFGYQAGKSNAHAIHYDFTPQLSSGSIGLGFRYFCGMK